ncbi:hypothetical protein PoB_005191900 [Plakobranchus ocellatus]|uniref:Uncharacterized protein n=1 Tax=Plakobranchus ocellatus TaxID=259542 RepID=A0AAV4BYV8_9GAST|nr:hypothetical protein PoB_005191900 [Plakobranchus ocellatus]
MVCQASDSQHALTQCPIPATSDGRLTPRMPSCYVLSQHAVSGIKLPAYLHTVAYPNMLCQASMSMPLFSALTQYSLLGIQLPACPYTVPFSNMLCQAHNYEYALTQSPMPICSVRIHIPT